MLRGVRRPEAGAAPRRTRCRRTSFAGESDYSSQMSDDEIERIAQALQAAANGLGPKRPPPPWTILTERSKAYWREKARTGAHLTVAA